MPDPQLGEGYSQLNSWLATSRDFRIAKQSGAISGHRKIAWNSSYTGFQERPSLRRSSPRLSSREFLMSTPGCTRLLTPLAGWF